MEEFGGTSSTSNIGIQQSEFLAPSSQYNKFSDSLRRVAPQTLTCSVFCGGRKCKYEKGSYWPPEANAINGIYSHWIIEEILAMSRPSTSVIQEYDILGQFDTVGIKSVINLEIPGEHANCALGPLHSSGFAYDPLLLMENGVYFYNYPWRDYGEASLAFLLDMVKVVSFSVAEGKVAIHCHAGLGRTGVLIACYLVYGLRMRANDAIRLVRKKRPGSIQSRLHILIVQQFDQMIFPNCIVFCNRDLLKDKKIQDFTLSQYLKRQRIILHGRESKSLRYIPKIINFLCERLLSVCGQPGIIPLDDEDKESIEPIPATPDTPTSDINLPTPSTRTITSGMDASSLENPEVHYKPRDVVAAFLSDHLNMSEGLSKYVRQYRVELNQKGQVAWIKLTKEKNLYVLTALLFVWLEHLRHPLLGSEELTVVVLYANDPSETLRRLPFETSMTLDYLLHFFGNLEPESHEFEPLLRRLATALTHRSVSNTSNSSIGMTVHPGYYTVMHEKGKPRRLSEGTLINILKVLRGIVLKYRTQENEQK